MQMKLLQISQFFCWDLATGAKIIGTLGVLKHSLTILVIYLDTIDLWVYKQSNGISTALCIFIALMLFVGFILNVINIVLSYRLFKFLETNQIQDLTNWINAERLYLTLLAVYFAIKIYFGDLDLKPVVRISSYIFDLYCYLCVSSLREDYKQRARLLQPQP